MRAPALARGEAGDDRAGVRRPGEAAGSALAVDDVVDVEPARLRPRSPRSPTRAASYSPRGPASRDAGVADRIAERGELGEPARPQRGQDRAATGQEDARPVDEVPLRHVGDRPAVVDVAAIPAQDPLDGRQVSALTVSRSPSCRYWTCTPCTQCSDQSGMVRPPPASISPTTTIGSMPSGGASRSSSR